MGNVEEWVSRLAASGGSSLLSESSMRGRRLTHRRMKVCARRAEGVCAEVPLTPTLSQRERGARVSRSFSQRDRYSTLKAIVMRG